MQDESVFNTPESNDSKQRSKSNNSNLILTIINVVLLVGLIVLYFIVLKSNDIPGKAITKASGNSVTVAYVNSDTILAKYALVDQMRKELEKSTAQYESDLQKRQTAFEKDASYFQEQVSKKTISEASAQEVYGSLMQEQQKLYELREKYSSDIAKREFDMNQLLLDSLNNFLKRYNQKMNFDYIFSYNRGGSILTANDSLDITQQVLDQLNEEYKEKND